MPVFRLKLDIEEIGQGNIYSTSETIAESEYGWQQFGLATGTADQAIPFNLTTGVTTIDLLLIHSDQTISWRPSATDTALTLDANKVHLLWGTNLTAILLTNASGSTANVEVFVAGV